jgi:hypothetical protein
VVIAAAAAGKTSSVALCRLGFPDDEAAETAASVVGRVQRT